MSRLDIKIQMKLLKEAKAYLKDVKIAAESTPQKKKDGIVLTEDHMMEWLQVFFEDRIMLDGCNQSKVKY